jgi:hypothetical protein
MAPKLAPRWPSFTDTTSIIKSRNSCASWEVVLITGVNLWFTYVKVNFGHEANVRIEYFASWKYFSLTNTHESFEREAEMAFEKGEIPVGAIVVVNNTVIARSHNLTELLNDNQRS